ncbi:hypothetical protein ACPWSR_07345 [Alloiococcus sp. CFN-8]|uniref:hypothetical protein n=1 Tax=Alloiococcus sp. CFN-8 TaxID=3416081 RepID=UPI003CFABA60
MKNKRILNALGQVDEKYIEEATPIKRGGKNRGWVRWGSIAVCLFLIIGGAFAWRYYDDTPIKPNQGITLSEDGVTIPPLNVTLSDNVEADMIGFFIYQERCYVQYEWIYGEVDFIDEYLGTATGLIDEWTSKDGYVELAGSVGGDFYSVKGFDPSFMLCMEHEDGSVSTYINNNGLTLKTGADLFDTRLHLAGNYNTVQYQSYSEWFNSSGDPIAIDRGYEETVSSFVHSLNAAQFMPTDDITLNEDEDLYDKEIWHLYFLMNNGMTIHLRLYEGGYVRFQGMMDICVKVEDDAFNAMTNIFSSGDFD